MTSIIANTMWTLEWLYWNKYKVLIHRSTEVLFKVIENIRFPGLPDIN